MRSYAKTFFWLIIFGAWMAMGNESEFPLCYVISAGVLLRSCYLLARCIAMESAHQGLARRDLREVYPPERDQFHRDLERLNRLRGYPPPVRNLSKREADEMVRRQPALINEIADYEHAQRMAYLGMWQGYRSDAVRESASLTGHGSCFCRECTYIQARYVAERSSAWRSPS